MNEQQLKRVLGTPPEQAVAGSRSRIERWFAQAARLVRWDVVQSPLGPLYLAAGEQGLHRLAFGLSQADFVRQLDPLARAERDPAALAAIVAQLQEYFSGARREFELELDLSRSTPFQRRVLQAANRIPWGAVWTYGQVARDIGKPGASRAVGQALGRNPVPIVIPCHRVVAGDGGLGGYSGGGGLESKKWLLRREGAL
jgi:methylated-DNA-[protein]-cysteine S-methyltransferase